MSKRSEMSKSWADMMSDASSTPSTPGRHTAALYQTTPSSNPGPEMTYEVSPNIYTHPIKHDHPLIDYWDCELLSKIIPVIQRTPLWLAIDVLRRGIVDEGQDCPITMVFTIAAKAFNAEEINAIFIEIQSIVRGSIYSGLRMEVREGTLHTHIALDAVQRKPNLGYSLGPCAHPRSGTIGGYVTVKKLGFPPKQCVLTAGHVVQEPPFAPLDPPCWTVDTWKFHRRTISSPSNQDYIDTINALKGFITGTTTKIHEIDDVLESHRTNEQKRELMHLANYNRQYNSLLESYHKIPRKFGRIFATSGNFAHSSGCILDWALVEVDPERKGENTIPHTPHFHPPTVRVETVRAIDADKDVIKFGRSTGLTVGKMSHIRSCLRMPGVMARMPNQFNSTTREAVFVGAAGGVFAEEGDSGAWVINREDGALVGLLWGGQRAGTQWSYATLISKVFGDIRRRLDATVEVMGEWEFANL